MAWSKFMIRSVFIAICLIIAIVSPVALVAALAGYKGKEIWEWISEPDSPVAKG